MIIRADARNLPIQDGSVDLVVTSPPYFALRSYTDGGQRYAGQVGAEASPSDYVDALIACTREMIRVLKPSGSIWLNLGDSYYSGKGAPGRTTEDAKTPARTARRAGGNPLDGPSFGIGRKSLVGLPWRYALRCIDELGLILRAEVIWNKPNGLPESVTDRTRRSHETWFHITKSPRYYSAVDRIRESVSDYSRPNGGAVRATPPGVRPRAMADTVNPLGALPGSVWTVATQPLKVPAHLGIDHFAAFPMEFPRRIIQGWSPQGVCTGCGEGRRPVAEHVATGTRTRGYSADSWNAGTLAMRGGHSNASRTQTQGIVTTVTGEVCACPDTSAPTTAGVVLDPFGGTGTVALVAEALGRTAISVDLSADYCRLARWRTSDPGQRAAALEVEKPPVQLPDQIGLFDVLPVEAV